jgi:hypothetical protein
LTAEKVGPLEVKALSLKPQISIVPLGKVDLTPHRRKRIFDTVCTPALQSSYSFSTL